MGALEKLEEDVCEGGGKKSLGVNTTLRGKNNIKK